MIQRVFTLFTSNNMSMSKYSIKDLEQITGIKAHTIRIWEKRYSIIQPERTKTNIRTYSDEDLKKLLNISMLNASGIKISRLAEMDVVDLEANVLKLSRVNKLEDTSIEKLILATLNFDEDLFESTLSRSVIEKGMEETTAQILFPFFHRVGILWQVGSISPAQEHFISNLIRQKLFAAIDSVSGFKKEGAHKIIFYLPEGELHEISILFYTYIAKKNGMQTLYLGQDLPFSELEKVIKDYQPNSIFTSFITPTTVDQLNQYLQNLKSSFAKVDLYITGMQLQQQGVIFPKGMKTITSMKDFKQAILV